MQDRTFAGHVRYMTDRCSIQKRCRTGRMHARTVDGHVRYMTEKMQYRTVPEKVRCRTGQMHYRTDA